jgi:hypothetical protein
LTDIMTLITALQQIPNHYPFARWQDSFADGLVQYTPENCAATQHIMDQLLLQLSQLGQGATSADQLAAMQQAVEALNDLNDQIDGLIETGEREDLCALFNHISSAIGLDWTQYGEGEGPASEWREW